MVADRQVIAIAGAGHLGKYVCEELLASPDFDVVVLTRQSANHNWLQSKHIPAFPTDYTTPSLLSILNTTRATTLISFLALTDTSYITIHSALLTACHQSSTCKRLIPSEWIGNIDAYPLKPDFYATTREPFREMLRAQDTVTWTLFNPGWLADYFLPSAKTHMKPIPDEFPVDPNGWRACVRGTGDEEQSWTCGRDVGRAVVELCKAKDWVYRPMPRTEKSWQQIQRALDKAPAADGKLTEESELAQVEEMMVMGCMACPKEKTLRQREKYFAQVRFRGLEELLRLAGKVDFV
ncbi:MAG: hypothetical protein Q9184_006862 [Pyrenodesmia sp. 2 TL-2023]